MGILLSFLAGCCSAASDLLSKRGLRSIDPYLFLLSTEFFKLPFLALCTFGSPTPQLETSFWLSLALCSLLESLSMYWYFKAISLSDVSLIIPLKMFTPAFLIITSLFMLHEIPPIAGIFGILLTMLGSYILYLPRVHEGYFAPFYSLCNDRGARYMLGTSLIVSFTNPVYKIGIEFSSPLLWGFSLNASRLVILSCFAYFFYRRKFAFSELKNRIPLLILVAGITAGELLLHLTALNYTFVSYVVSIKRISVLISVAGGVILFKERGLRERTASSLLMFIGLIIIVFSK